MKIEAVLRELYSTEQITKIKIELADLFDKDVERNFDWHKELNLYVTYPDAFVDGDKPGLLVLKDRLASIASMGFNAIHILPIFESPMIDAGFDISDYYKIRDDLGGNEAFEEVLAEAKRLDMKVFIDVVFNHISEKHVWFQKALAGEEKYRNYFLNRNSLPEFIRKFEDDCGVWAEYNYDNNTVKTRVIFPEQVGEVPHWREFEDGYWYYHTFYPNQLDVNWLNPDVFIEFSKILAYWAEKGVSFRLDAFTFIGKDIEKGNTESSPAAFQILEALHQIVENLDGDSVFLIETCQDIKTIIKYFGNENGKYAELAYNFPLMNELWNTILTRNCENIYQLLDEASNIPEWSNWITFLRNHDELSLEFVASEDRELVLSKLDGKGLPFREGFGVSGRTASFLNNDPNRVVLAYLLLLSLPGNPAIIYGDEVCKENDFENMHNQLQKKHVTTSSHAVEDTRDINRGYIDITASKLTESAIITQNEVSKMFNTRLDFAKYINTHPKNISKDLKVKSNILALEYAYGNKSLICIVNLGEVETSMVIEDGYDVVLQISDISYGGSNLTVGENSGVWLVK